MPRISRYLSPVMLAVLCLLGTAGRAQRSPSLSEYPDSRIDIYAGYGYLHPINSGIDGKQYQDVYKPNATASVSYYFNHFFGVQMEGSYFDGDNEHLANYPTCFRSFCDQLLYTAQAGPVMRYPLGRFVPFIHALGGGERMNGPAAQPLKWGWGVTGGGGVDYVVPFFSNHLAVRLIQADFQYSQVVYGPLQLPAGVQGGFGELDALKLSAGLVLRFGKKEDEVGVETACTVAPEIVHPGETVTATSSTVNLNPNKKSFYTWSTSGGKLVPEGTSATIDTTGLAPGDYTVGAHVQQGPKPRQQSQCQAVFTVKPFEPPTLRCSTVPSTANSGDTISITTVGSSPQNRPLTYSYTTSAGQITSNGPTAALTTAGLGASTITVGCTVVDDFGQTASSSATVQILAPPVPVLAQEQSLCGLSFVRDRKRPVRVDNESKACLDDIALTMNQQTDARLEIIGNASSDENPEAAAERSLNVRQYLTQEKGVDPARIEVRVGDTSGRTVRNILVPAGAIFNDDNTQTFDENAIHRSGQAYGVSRARTTVAPTRRRTVRRKPAATTSGSAMPPAAFGTPGYQGPAYQPPPTQ